MRIRHSAEQRIADWLDENAELRKSSPAPTRRRFLDVDPVALREQLTAQNVTQVAGDTPRPIVPPERFP